MGDQPTTFVASSVLENYYVAEDALKHIILHMEGVLGETYRGETGYALRNALWEDITAAIDSVASVHYVSNLRKPRGFLVHIKRQDLVERIYVLVNLFSSL